MRLIQIIKNNKKSIVVGSLSFVTCAAFIGSLWFTQQAVKHFKDSSVKKACVDAYKIMCVQVHACGAGNVKDCDDTVAKMHRCDDADKLPIKEVVTTCEEDLRHIECTDDVPSTCQTFMLE
jgi:hypothetical protein